MGFKTEEVVTIDFTTQAPTTGAATDADSLPTGKLVINGTDDVAAVTVTNKETGVYKAVVTLPTVADGDELQLRINATVGGIAGKAVIWTGDGVATRPQDVFARLGAPVGASVSEDVAAIQADLPTRITKNVALENFPFLMVLASDDITPATGLTVTATRSIDGAAFVATANAVSEITFGWYKISLANSDLNGNTIALRFTAPTANDRNLTIVTQAT